MLMSNEPSFVSTASAAVAVETHLSYAERINLGGYYTHSSIVETLYQMLRSNIANLADYTLVDNACGYGNFFSDRRCAAAPKCIGIDIDKQAVTTAKKNHRGVCFYHANSLHQPSRGTYGIGEQDKIIMLGNPPYNDKTSLIRSSVKTSTMRIDEDLTCRDLGMSFLRSYDKLKADYVCVLHPLSYLIKASNFKQLGAFKDNYRLVDSLVFSSSEFAHTSKTMSFPIIIALYQRAANDSRGAAMDYRFIQNHTFTTMEGKQFKINDFDYIQNYVDKYPNQHKVSKAAAIAYFWTMRDINALHRNKSFVPSASSNSIFITKERMPYYCYVDVFKNHIAHIPYYFGNCDIMINHNEFAKIIPAFKRAALARNEVLQQQYGKRNKSAADDKTIAAYFKNLLGAHYVY